MRIERARTDDVWQVAIHMRERDCEEFLAITPARNRGELAAVLHERYGGHPDVLCAWVGEEPIAVGAMLHIRPNVSSLMFYATDSFPRIGLAMTKFIKQRLFPRYRASGVHRIECACLDSYAEIHRWIETLGLTREATLRGFGKNGETFAQFSWVDPRVCPAGA